MTDVIRMLAPKIIGIVIALILVWIIASVLKKYIDAEYHKWITKIAKWTMWITLGGFAIHVIYFASVNCVPRCTPDYSQKNQGIKNFENRIEKESNKSKSN